MDLYKEGNVTAGSDITGEFTVTDTDSVHQLQNELQVRWHIAKTSGIATHKKVWSC